MLDIVYVSDTNKMGTMKFKWLKWLIETLIPEANVRQAFTPNEVYKTKTTKIGDEEVCPEYNVIYAETNVEGTLKEGPDGDNTLWESCSSNPDVIICDDLTRANPGCSQKIYNRSIIFYEAIKRGIQTHVIAPDVTMSYAGGLELARKTKLPFNKFSDFSNVYVWYGVNDIARYKDVSTWNQIWKKMPNSNPKCNLITAVCYAYLKNHEKEIKESMKNSLAYSKDYSCYAYYGFWRRGSLLDNVMNSGVDRVIGSFKWHKPCDEHGIEWINGNKSLEEIFSEVTKAYIPREGIKNDIQHIFRQFEGLAYARDGVEYDPEYPEEMRVYSFDDPKLKDLYGPIINEFINLIKSSRNATWAQPSVIN